MTEKCFHCGNIATERVMRPNETGIIVFKWACGFCTSHMEG